MKARKYVAAKISFLINGIRRFAVPFVYTVVIFLTASYTILAERNQMEVVRLILSLGFGFFVSILLTLLTERYQKKWNVYLMQALSLVAAAACYLWLKNFDTDVYAVMGYIGLMVAVVACIIFFLYDEGNKTLLAPHLLKGFVFSAAISGILMSGLSLCIMAFNAIIIHLDSLNKVMGILGVFCAVMVAVNLFLSGVPRQGEAIHLPKVVKILIATVGLPIYLLLLLILYLYLGKILITWNLPSNEINLYASLAALFFILFHLTIGSYAEENRLVAWFMKWGKFLLIPIILVQLLAIYVRVSAYGITTPRYLSIILVCIVLVFLGFAIFKGGKYLRWIFPVIAAVAILFTFTPLNVIDVPDRVQYNRLVAILEENDMIQAGQVVPGSNVPADDMREITDIFGYLVGRGGNSIELVTDFRSASGSDWLETGTFKRTFGFPPYYAGNSSDDPGKYRYYEISFVYDNLDLTPYTVLVYNVMLQSGGTEVTADSPRVVVAGSEGTEVEIEIYSTLEELVVTGQDGQIEGWRILPAGEGGYCITMLNFNQTEEGFFLSNMEGFLLE